MDPVQVTTSDADPMLASQTTDYTLQAAIARDRPDLWAALAANPATYPDLLAWLSATNEPAVLSALAARTGADAESVGTVVTAEPDEPAEVADAAPAPEAETSAGPVTTAAPVVAGATPRPVEDPHEAPTRVRPSSWPTAAPMPTPTELSSLSALSSQDPATVVPTAGSRRPTLMDWATGWLVTAVMVLVLVLGTLGTWYVQGGEPGDGLVVGSGSTAASGSGGAAADSGSGSSGTRYITPCGSAPEFTVLSVEDAAGALDVRVKVTAVCPEGDVLGGAANAIVLYGTSSTNGTGPADAVVASGDFDFSSAPLVIPDNGAVVTLRFGTGHFFRTAEDIDVDTMLVECVPDRSGAGASIGSGGGLTASPDQVSTSKESTDSAAEEDAAGDALRWQANHDKPIALSTLSGKWTPQLSSKKPGLVADGMTWDNRATLGEFLTLRQKYPSALLLYSDEWPVFDAGGGWWVTVAGVPFNTADEANAWCDAQGFDGDHCFAKYIDPNGSPQGTTVGRN